MSNDPGNDTPGIHVETGGPGNVGDRIQNDAGSGDSGGFGDHIIIDPANVGGKNRSADNDGDRASGSGRRGRPRGSKNTSKKGSSLPVDGIAATLLSIHTMLSVMTRTPEWEIEADEAKMIASASANVARHYGAEMTQKAMDWTNLFGALGVVYVTRIVAIRARKNTERRTPQKPAMTNGLDTAGLHVEPVSPFAPPPPRH